MTVVPASTPTPRAMNTATSDTRWKRNETTDESYARRGPASEQLAQPEQELPPQLHQLLEEQLEGLGHGHHGDHGEQGRPDQEHQVPAPNPTAVHPGHALGVDQDLPDPE